MTTTIRLATANDADGVRAVYSGYFSTPITFETDVPSVEEMRGRIEKVLPSYPWLVAEEGDIVIGYAYASRHRERAAYGWSVDVSAYVHSERKRQGLGRSLYSALFPILVRQGYVNAYAGITLPNAASVGLHTTMGFEPVGVYKHVGFKCGAWHDVG